MKISNPILKIVYSFFLFLCLNVAFAQTEPGFGEDVVDAPSAPTDFSDDVVDAPAAPIESNLIWLGIMGTLYAGYYFYTRRNKTVKTD